MGAVYKYLYNEEFASTWINGGRIPIFPASTYRAVDRRGTNTPDEVIKQKFSTGSVKRAFESNAFGFDRNFLGPVRMNNVTIQGFQDQLRPLNINGMFVRSEQDAFIDCYSCEFSEELMVRLETKNTCVEIDNIDGLLDEFDKQIGIKSIRRKIIYTKGLERDHFVKSDEDSWQKEFRAVWDVSNVASLVVVVPSGFCRRVI